MTVQVETPVNKLNYTGPGRYDFDFSIFVESDLVVTHISTTGVITALAYSTDYLLTLVGEDQSNPGYVDTTFSETTGTLSLARDVPISQPTDWVNNDSFDMEILEASMDRLTMMMQQVSSLLTTGVWGYGWRGDWATNIEYEVNDYVIAGDSDNVYMCLEEHTSVTFATDLTNGLWALVINMEQVQDLIDEAEASKDAAGTSETNAADSADHAADSAAICTSIEAAVNSCAADIDAAVTGLEAITEGGNTGWRLVGRVAANYGDIGSQGVDLSYSGSSSSTRGATGLYSFASGYETIASGLISTAEGIGTLAYNTGAHAEGDSTEATGPYSHAEGSNTLASGTYSHAAGSYTIAQNSAQTSIGKYNVGTDTGTILEVGIGTGSSAKANGLEVHTDGKVVMPALPTSDPTEAGALWNDSGTLKISAG